MGGVRRPGWWAWVGIALTVGAALVALEAGLRTHDLVARRRPAPPGADNLTADWCAAPYVGYAVLGLLTLRHPPAAAALLAATLETAAAGVWLYANDRGYFFGGNLIPSFALMQWVWVGVSGAVVVLLRVAEHYAFQAPDPPADRVSPAEGLGPVGERA